MISKILKNYFNIFSNENNFKKHHTILEFDISLRFSNSIIVCPFIKVFKI
jgi:hypothetical protein